MTTPTEPTTPTAPHGRTHPTMTTPTCTETVSPNMVRAALVKGTMCLHCSTWRQPAESLAESRTGLGLHPLGNATGSRDAP
ncbi:MAG: hypothetical protein ACRDQU_04060 [Pseudonocardiaceae bacterium]